MGVSNIQQVVFLWRGSNERLDEALLHWERRIKEYIY